MNDKLFNKMRPQSLADVKGHTVVVEKVRRWFQNDTIPSFILMHGCRGCGKTTVARIIAKVANCEHPTADGPCGECDSCKAAALGVNQDILELDAASKNKVEDVKALVEKLGYVPFYKRKVVILDEVHRLSAVAFDSLLKTLEEPPENVIFIFATTELQKIPDTIVSRARKLEFSALPVNVITERLAEICKKYEKPYEDAALVAIAKASRGAMRDAINYLEDFFEVGITEENALNELGLANELKMIQIIEGICKGDYTVAVNGFRGEVSKGAKLQNFIDSMISVCLDLMQANVTGTVKEIGGTDCYKEAIATLSGKVSFVKLSEICNEFSRIRPIGLEAIQIEGLIISLLVEGSSVSRLEEEVETLKLRVAALENGQKNNKVNVTVAETINEAPQNPTENNELPFDEGTLFDEATAAEKMAAEKMAEDAISDVVTTDDFDPDGFVGMTPEEMAELFDGEELGELPGETPDAVRTSVKQNADESESNEDEEDAEEETEADEDECDNCPYQEECNGTCVKERLEKAKGEGEKEPEEKAPGSTAEDVGDFFSSLARLF